MLLLYGCAGASGQPAANGQQPPAGSEQQPAGNSQTPTPAPAPAQQVKEFTVEASQWQFSPDTITVSKGDRVKITLVNKDVSHGIAIPQFGFSLKAAAGETAIGEFTADKAGNYTFFCNVVCGEGHKSMKGTLVVQ